MLPLHYIAAARCVTPDETELFEKVIRMLVERGANINEPDTPSGDTPLHHAASRGALTSVIFLSEIEGVNLDAKNYAGETCLKVAMKKGRLNIARELLERGASGLDPAELEELRAAPVARIPSRHSSWSSIPSSSSLGSVVAESLSSAGEPANEPLSTSQPANAADGEEGEREEGVFEQDDIALPFAAPTALLTPPAQIPSGTASPPLSLSSSPPASPALSASPVSPTPLSDTASLASDTHPLTAREDPSDRSVPSDHIPHSAPPATSSTNTPSPTPSTDSAVDSQPSKKKKSTPGERLIAMLRKSTEYKPAELEREPSAASFAEAPSSPGGDTTHPAGSGAVSTISERAKSPSPAIGNAVSTPPGSAVNSQHKRRISGPSDADSAITPRGTATASSGATAARVPTKTATVQPHVVMETSVDTPFADGFLRYLETGEFADVNLVCKDGRAFSAHRIVLAYCSDYFRELFTENSTRSVIELEALSDPDGYFGDVLRFMYTGEIEISLVRAVGLLTLSEAYGISELRRICTEFLSANVNRLNVFELLKRALLLGTKSGSESPIVEKCLSVLAKNFYHLSRNGMKEFAFLSPALFVRLLRSEYIAVKREYLLYKAICDYVSLQREELDREPTLVPRMMETVRFRWMTLEELEEASANPLVPRHLLIEALTLRVAQHEAPERLDALAPAAGGLPRVEPRLARGIEFEYGYDFDTQGIIHWIATNGNTEPWSNPHIAGRITVTCSSIEKGTAANIVEKEPSEVWTMDVPSSWFAIDLGEGRSVVPTYYTLRHGGSFKADSLRNWDFQGAKDGKHWKELRRHANDTSLNSSFAVSSWPVTGIKEAYRYFRILQTGRNSSNHNFLALSGFELYGYLYETNRADHSAVHARVAPSGNEPSSVQPVVSVPPASNTNSSTLSLGREGTVANGDA